MWSIPARRFITWGGFFGWTSRQGFCFRAPCLVLLLVICFHERALIEADRSGASKASCTCRTNHGGHTALSNSLPPVSPDLQQTMVQPRIIRERHGNEQNKTKSMLLRPCVLACSRRGWAATVEFSFSALRNERSLRRAMASARLSSPLH